MSSINIYSISLGCPKNLVDTENLLGSLSQCSCLTQDLEQAQVVLINTCAFIEPAVEESVQTILEIAADIAELPAKPLLVVTGCLVARYAPDIKSQLPEVDLWLSLHEQHNWPFYLNKALKTQLLAEKKRILSTPSGTAYLKISEGCNHKCKFCTIPWLRGPLRSRSIQDIIQEATWLIENNVQEITLVAQDLTAYGQDLGLRNGLISVLENLLPLDGLKWLRLLYLYPAGLNTELLSFLSQCGPPLLPYLDIPLQHAHPEVLKNMGRPFANNPFKVVDKVRKFLPGAALRSTLIVGYPGETNKAFDTLLDFVARVRFNNLGVFCFYPEQGTRAALLNDQIDRETKQKRQQEIMDLQAGISTEILSVYPGKSETILVDSPHPEWPTLYQGRTWFQALEIDGITYISGQNIQPGDMVQARIQEAHTYDLTALTWD